MSERHLFLSPHPDDVVLSCGGVMQQIATAGHEVLVLTLMAGDAPNPLPESPLIPNIHRRWGLGDQPMAARREEDQCAVEMLGGTVHWTDWQDAIYRTDDRGQALYTTDDLLFGDIQAADPLAGVQKGTLALDFSHWQPLTALHIPLGAGGHVDHIIVRTAAISGWHSAPDSVTNTVEIFFYEEYPYSSEAGEVLHSHAGDKPRLAGPVAIQNALDSLNLFLEPDMRPISDAQLARKIEAIRCYESQLSTFWDNADTMTERVRNNAYLVGTSGDVPLAERLWALE